MDRIATQKNANTEDSDKKARMKHVKKNMCPLFQPSYKVIPLLLLDDIIAEYFPIVNWQEERLRNSE